MLQPDRTSPRSSHTSRFLPPLSLHTPCPFACGLSLPVISLPRLPSQVLLACSYLAFASSKKASLSSVHSDTPQSPCVGAVLLTHFPWPVSPLGSELLCPVHAVSPVFGTVPGTQQVLSCYPVAWMIPSRQQQTTGSRKVHGWENKAGPTYS